MSETAILDEAPPEAPASDEPTDTESPLPIWLVLVSCGVLLAVIGFIFGTFLEQRDSSQHMDDYIYGKSITQKELEKANPSPIYSVTALEGSERICIVTTDVRGKLRVRAYNRREKAFTRMTNFTDENGTPHYGPKQVIEVRREIKQKLVPGFTELIPTEDIFRNTDRPPGAPGMKAYNCPVSW